MDQELYDRMLSGELTPDQAYALDAQAQDGGGDTTGLAPDTGSSDIYSGYAGDLAGIQQKAMQDAMAMWPAIGGHNVAPKYQETNFKALYSTLFNQYLSQAKGSYGAQQDAATAKAKAAQLAFTQGMQGRSADLAENKFAYQQSQDERTFGQKQQEDIYKLGIGNAETDFKLIALMGGVEGIPQMMADPTQHEALANMLSKDLTGDENNWHTDMATGYRISNLLDYVDEQQNAAKQPKQPEQPGQPGQPGGQGGQPAQLLADTGPQVGPGQPSQFLPISTQQWQQLGSAPARARELWMRSNVKDQPVVSTPYGDVALGSSVWHADTNAPLGFSVKDWRKSQPKGQYGPMTDQAGRFRQAEQKAGRGSGSNNDWRQAWQGRQTPQQGDLAYLLAGAMGGARGAGRGVGSFLSNLRAGWG